MHTHRELVGWPCHAYLTDHAVIAEVQIVYIFRAGVVLSHDDRILKVALVRHIVRAIARAVRIRVLGIDFANFVNRLIGQCVIVAPEK